MNKENKIYGYVASGGGSKGAWGGGVSEYLIKDLKRNYKYLSGTSTGNLLMGLVASKEIDKLYQAYTSVTNKDIYSIPPYTIKSSKNGIFKTRMNYLRIAYNMFIRGKKTFGDSTVLREKTIPEFFTEENYNKVLKSDIELISTVTNLTHGKTEFKSNFDPGTGYKEFLDWMYASACAVPFMSIVNKNNYEYADGGYIQSIPIQPLIDRGCDEIDVILHRDPKLEISKSRNALHIINRIIDITMWDSASNDIALAKLKAKEKDVIINVYQPELKLTNNSLVFDKKVMQGWWKDGYNYAKNVECVSYMISGRKKPKLIKK